jgi:hypothetical protein
MKPPILHIGFPKTSSTWFQENFYPYIKSGYYMNREAVQDLFLSEGAFDWNQNECQLKLKKLIEGKTDRIIICEELLLGRLRPGGVKHFVTREVGHRLKSIFPEATVVIFIRNQLDALASAYSQYIQSGGNYNIDTFLHPERISGGDYNSLVLLGPDYFLYHKAIDYYASLYGEENLFVFLYEEFRDSNSSFVTSFSKKLGISVDMDRVSFDRVNEGYRALLVAPRKFFNAFTRKGPLNKYYLVHIPNADKIIRKIFATANKYRFFGMRPSAGKILGRRNVEYLNSYYKKSNQILVEKYGLTGIKNYNYPI